MGRKICCHRKGYKSVLAACTAALTVSRPYAITTVSPVLSVVHRADAGGLLATLDRQLPAML